MNTRYATYSAMVVAAAIGLSFTLNVHANTLPQEDRGHWVATSADDYDAGFVNQTSRVTMILKNSQGQEAIRELRIRVLEVDNDGDKSLTIFDEPPDVKGTSFLSYSHSPEPDDQWLYLPALKRVKRISSSNKSGPFMGSEFAYEDLASQEVDKYSYTYIAADTVLGEPGHVIERRPVDPNSGYTRQLVWIDATHWRTEKIEYYDRKNVLLKTLAYSGYRQYANNKWRADTMHMTNHQNGKSTTLNWDDIQFGVRLSSRDFDVSALKRTR